MIGKDGEDEDGGGGAAKAKVMVRKGADITRYQIQEKEIQRRGGPRARKGTKG